MVTQGVVRLPHGVGLFLELQRAEQGDPERVPVPQPGRHRDDERRAIAGRVRARDPAAGVRAGVHAGGRVRARGGVRERERSEEERERTRHRAPISGGGGARRGRTEDPDEMTRAPREQGALDLPEVRAGGPRRALGQFRARCVQSSPGLGGEAFLSHTLAPRS